MDLSYLVHLIERRQQGGQDSMLIREIQVQFIITEIDDLLCGIRSW